MKEIKWRTRRSAGVAIFRLPLTENGERYENQDPDFYQEPYMLLVQQYGSQWSIPKGGKEPEDKTLFDTAVREVKEEVGLTDGIEYNAQGPSNRRNIFQKVRRLGKGGTPTRKEITFFFGLCTVPHEQLLITTPEKAITDTMWANFSEAKELLPKKDYKAVRKLYREAIWNFTTESACLVRTVEKYTKERDTHPGDTL